MLETFVENLPVLFDFLSRIIRDKFFLWRDRWDASVGQNEIQTAWHNITRLWKPIEISV